MTSKKKVAICGALAGLLGLLGALGSPLCQGLPAEYKFLCFAGAEAAKEGSKAIKQSMPEGEGGGGP